MFHAITSRKSVFKFTFGWGGGAAAWQLPRCGAPMIFETDKEHVNTLCGQHEKFTVTADCDTPPVLSQPSAKLLKFQPAA